jgi:hypothetical protein
MDDMTPITYRDFWDVPRIFVAQRRGAVFLFDCAFDDKTEDYPSSYRVYLLPNLGDEDLAGSWDKLHLRAHRFLGEVPIASVRFDATRRRALDAGLLDALAAAPPESNPAEAGGAGRRVG